MFRVIRAAGAGILILGQADFRFSLGGKMRSLNRHSVRDYERVVKARLRLYRDWIAVLADRIGVRDVPFTSGDDDRFHPPFWQSLPAMQKPGAPEADLSPGSAR